MILFRKKIERLLEIQKQKTAEYKFQGKYEDDEEIKLGLKEISAIIISAVIVFGPIFLILIAMMYFLTKPF